MPPRVPATPVAHSAFTIPTDIQGKHAIHSMELAVLRLQHSGVSPSGVFVCVCVCVKGDRYLLTCYTVERVQCTLHSGGHSVYLA